MQQRTHFAKTFALNSLYSFEKEDCRVNAKSLLGVLSLGIVKGTTITLIADGADEAAAIDGLVALIESEFAGC